MLFKSLTAAALCIATLGTAAGFTISPVQLSPARLSLRPAASLPVGSSISARPSSRIAPAGGLAMQGGEKHPLHGALDKVIDDFSIRSDSFLLRAPEPLLPAAVICIPLRLCWNENGGPPRHGLMLLSAFTRERCTWCPGLNCCIRQGVNGAARLYNVDGAAKGVARICNRLLGFKTVEMLRDSLTPHMS